MNAKNLIKRGLVGLLGTAALFAGGAAIYASLACATFDASMQTVYDVPLPTVARSKDPAVLARGKHLIEAVAACSSRDCHGSDLAGGTPLDVGPLGTFVGPNVTAGGLGAAYSDAELARLLKHGIKKDGRSIRMMPVQEFAWLPDSDVSAIVSYLRTVPAVDKPNGTTKVGILGKIMDRREAFTMDIARHVDHSYHEQPTPAPTAEYGRYLSSLCQGCHGKGLSGGPIPGAPPSLPIPLNLTSHPTGLKEWTFADFETLMRKGIRKNGKTLDPFMPVTAFGKMDDVEMHALWAYVQSLPPVEAGNR